MQKSHSVKVVPVTSTITSPKSTKTRFVIDFPGYDKKTINIKLIQKLIEKDLERKLPQKMRIKLKQSKELVEMIKSSINSPKDGQSPQPLSPLRRQKYSVQEPSLSPPQLSTLGSMNNTKSHMFDIRSTAVTEQPSLLSPKLKPHVKPDIQIGSFVSHKSEVKTTSHQKNFQLISRLSQISNQNTKIREAVVNELNRIQITNNRNYLQERIKNYIEGQSAGKLEDKYLKKVQQMEEETRKQMQYSKYSLLPHYLSDQQEFRNITLLFNDTQKQVIDDQKSYHKKNLFAGKYRKTQNIKLLDSKNFDFNKYHAISPFAAKRDSTPVVSKSSIKLDPITKNLDEKKQKIDEILVNCNKHHNFLSTFCKKKGKVVQKRFDTLNENHNFILKQIDVAKDQLFMQLCKKTKQQQRFRQTITEGLSQDWKRMAQELKMQEEREKMKEVYGKYVDMLMPITVEDFSDEAECFFDRKREIIND